MPLVSQKVTNIFGGVSQMPPAQRASSQADEQINTYSVWGRSVMRRPPLVYLAKLTAIADSAATVIPINTKEGRKFFAVITGGTVRCFDAVTGVEITVTSVASQAYLAAATAGFRWTNSGDSTFIVNRSTTVKSGTLKTAAVVREGMVWVRQGDYSTKYTVTLNGINYTYTTPDSSAAGARAAIATDAIASQLYGLILAAATFSATPYGSTIYLKPLNGADFTLQSTDGLADKGLVTIKGRVQRFTDLPQKAKANVIVEITGDDSSKFDNYFVQYDDSASPGELGVWKEVPKPDLILGLDDSTMPHNLMWKGRFIDETVAAGPFVNPPAAYSLGNQASVSFGAYTYYPAGITITIAVTAGPTWTYTTVGGKTAASIVAAALIASINGTAGWAATTQAIPETIQFNKSPLAAFSYTATLTGWNANTQFYNSDMRITNASIGRTVQNLTDGSTGTITGVDGITGTQLTVGALTGGADNRFDAGDVIVVVGTGDYFTFSRPKWKSRVSGDDTTAPFPSFVGRTLSDIFVHKNRLGFTAKDAVVLSRTADLFNFFRQTANQLLADDLIDVKSSVPGTPDFHAALNWNESLYLFTEKQQLELTGDPILSPQTVELKTASRYENAPAIRPAVTGNRIFFVGLKNRYPRVMDYHTLGNDRTLVSADEVSEQVPSYLLQSNPSAIVGDDAEGVVVLSDAARQTCLNVYSYFYEGDTRVQSAWCRWEFPVTMKIVGTAIAAGVLAVVASHPDGLYLYNADLDPVRLASTLRYNGEHLYDGTETYTSPNP